MYTIHRGYHTLPTNNEMGRGGCWTVTCSSSYFNFKIHFKIVEDFSGREILYFCTVMYHISEKLR